jgi:hypothetical protein
MPVGTLTTYDMLATRFQIANTRLSEIGEDQAYKAIADLLADHNAIMRSLVGDLAEFTTARDAIYGGGDNMNMWEVDELGTAPPSKMVLGSIVGFPLRRFEAAWQGSKKWLQRATMGELLGQVNGMRMADKLNLIRALKVALFTPTNYTWIDYTLDRRNTPPIAVKALVNADGMPIPPGPNGEIFNAATHTHYLGTGSFVTSDLVAAKNTVLEHYPTGDFVIAISTGQEAAIRGMTPNFVASVPGGIVVPTTAYSVPGLPLDIVPIGRRTIGEFDGIPVEVKPWVPSGYVVVYNRNVRPLAIRIEDGIAGAGDLQIDAQDEEHPLRAETYSREFGVGVMDRVGAAVLYTGNATYASPVF